jgi:hypothetical protein
MAEPQELDWIVQKASELLLDKVKDAPLTDRDIGLAFEIFARPRLKKLSDILMSRQEHQRAVKYITTKLREYAEELNSKHWPKG